MSVAVRCENMENSMPPPPLPPQRRPPPPVNRPYKRRALFQITKVRDYNIRRRRYPSAAAGRRAPVTTLSDDDAAARHFEQTQLIFFTIDTYLFCKFIFNWGFLFIRPHKSPRSSLSTSASRNQIYYGLSVCLSIISITVITFTRQHVNLTKTSIVSVSGQPHIIIIVTHCTTIVTLINLFLSITI